MRFGECGNLLLGSQQLVARCWRSEKHYSNNYIIYLMIMIEILKFYVIRLDFNVFFWTHTSKTKTLFIQFINTSDLILRRVIEHEATHSVDGGIAQEFVGVHFAAGDLLKGWQTLLGTQISKSNCVQDFHPDWRASLQCSVIRTSV